MDHHLSIVRKLDDSHQKYQYIRCVNDAHESIVVVYAREKVSRDMARSLRPEFAKVYIVNEFKDTLRLIEKGNRSDDLENTQMKNNSVDMIIADADYCTPKFLEYLQKRAEDPKTGHFPVISVALLLPENMDVQSRTVYANNDFCSVCIECPYSATTVLDRLLEVLRKRKMIEGTYKAIRKKAKNKEYPFIPIFADGENDNDDQEVLQDAIPNNDRATVLTAGTDHASAVTALDKDGTVQKSVMTREEGGRKVEEIVAQRSRSIYSIDDVNLEEDDWLDCDGLLPPFIEQMRESIYPTLGKLKHSEHGNKLSIERKKRRVADKRIMRIICSENESSRSRSHRHPQRHHSDGGYESGAVLDHHLEDASYPSGSDMSDDDDGLQSASSATLAIALNDTMKHLAGIILSNKMRSIRDQDEKTHSKAVDVHPFIDRPPPDISEAKTVVGFNKRVAESCWRVIHDRNAIDGPAPDLARRKGSAPNLRKGTSQIAPSPPSLVLPAVVIPSSKLDKSDSQSSISSKEVSLQKLGKSESQIIQMPLQVDTSDSSPSLNPLSKWSSLRNLVKNSPSSKKAVEVPHSLSVRWSSVLDLTADKSKVSVPPSKEKAIKLVKKMASEAPVNGVMYKLMSVDLASRKISAGEWVYLAQGIKRRDEGDFAKAVSSFTRAIRQSRQPQLPMIFRGTTYFEQRKYLAALNEFSSVMKLLHGMTDAQYNKDDDFLARYNRGIINFCLGDDTNGIQDLRAALALELDPMERGRDVLMVRSTLALALRRIGNFDESINELLTCKKIEADLQDNFGMDYNSQSLHGSGSVDERNIHTPSQSIQIDSRPHSPIGFASSSTSKSSSSLRMCGSRRDFSKIITKEPVNVELLSPVSMSIKDRKVLLMQQQRTKKDLGSQQLGPLDAFKTVHGVKRDLFDTLFVKPSPVQASLLVESALRTPEQLDVIRSVLQGCEFFKNLPVGAFEEMAGVVEYRTLSSKGRLFIQGQPVDAVCFVLSGRVQIKLDIIHESIVQSEIIGEALENEVFGEVDTLFQNPEFFVLDFLKESRSDESKASSFADTDAAAVDTLQTSSVSILPFLDAQKNFAGDVNTLLLPKALQPGSFMSFNVDVPTELISIPLDTFRRWLLPPVSTMFRERLDVLRRCGVFTMLPMFDVVRLARSCTIKRYRAGDVILKQGLKPSFLFIVISGLCRVVKVPSRVEGILRKLSSLRVQQQTFDTKYVFHHMMRDQFQHANSNEVEKMKLAAEIERLEELLIRVRQMDAREEEAARACNSSPVKKEIEISMLNHGKIFGEACVLNPESGVALGSVIADTVCEVLSLHKLYLQTIHINDSLITRLRERAVVYPDDDVLIADNEFLQEWNAYKDSLLRKLHDEKHRTLSPTKSKLNQLKK